MSKVSLNKILEEFSHLTLEDKEYVIEVIKKQITEAKREAIYRRAKEAIENFKKGRVKKGTVKELYKDLEVD